MATSKKGLAIVTMVRGDYHWAKLWLRHYQTQVQSKQDLYVIIHGSDDQLAKIFAGCSVIHAPLEDGGLVNFERKRLDFEHFFIRGLQAYFKCVLMVDIDELVTLPPHMKQPLYDYLPSVHSGEMVRSALGFELVDPKEENAPEIDLDQPILGQRRWAYCNAQYCKPCAFYFNFGGATHHRVFGAPWLIDPNLLLFHLRYCDKTLLNDYVQTRKKLFLEQRETGSASSNSWKTPWKEYVKLMQETEKFDNGVLDHQTRDNLRRVLLERLMKTNRLGTVASGLLEIPKEYGTLL